jgi:hypothetical protein
MFPLYAENAKKIAVSAILLALKRASQANLNLEPGTQNRERGTPEPEPGTRLISFSESDTFSDSYR